MLRWAARKRYFFHRRMGVLSFREYVSVQRLNDMDETMVRLDGGAFLMGSAAFYPEERPVRR
ncbi:MAG: hypothetical protein ABR591_07845, partial [Candidatus Velthaea sp.]